jgi:hypothetical protein
MPGDIRFESPIDTQMTSFGLAYMQNRARYFSQDDFFPFVPFDAWNGAIFAQEAAGTLRPEEARAGDETGYPTVSFRGKAIPFLAEDWGLQNLVTSKMLDITRGPGLPLTARRQRQLTEKVWLNREVRTEALVGAVADNVSLAGAFKWNSTTAVPRTDVMTGKRTVLQFTGREPNKIVLTGTVTDDLITRESAGSAGLSIKTAIQYVMQATGRQINEPLIAAYFDVDLVRFAKGVRMAANTAPAGTPGTALPSQGTYVLTQDRAYLVYNEDDPGPETSNYGVSPGKLSYGARNFEDPMKRGIWVQVFQQLIEFVAEAKSIYVVGTVL